MQFTGSNQVARAVSIATQGKVRIEDAGFNWKIMGPDVRDVETVASICDQDAYANAGQKCSATSMLVLHKNWMKDNSTTGLLGRIEKLASQRKLEDLTLAPVLTVTTERFLQHTQALLEKVKGAKLLWGGEALPTGTHTIPSCYGAVKPTAVFVPLDQILGSNFELITTEIFGPFQIVTCWDDSVTGEFETLCKILNKMENHLTAAVCTNDVLLQQRLLKETVNGTTYCGIRARTTGAPQNHWFGPCSDPRAAGIGSPEAIQLVWSGHREIIHDVGPVPSGFKVAQS